MNLNEEVEGNKKELLNKSDNDLLLIIHKNEAFSAAHIAAKQILHQRQQNKLDEQIIISKHNNRLTVAILIFTIILLVITVVQYLRQF